MRKNYIEYFLCISIFIAGCSVTKDLPAEEKLYTGADVKVKSEEKVKGKGKYKSELKNLIRPKANSKILGYPFRLWIFNSVKNVKKEKGFKHWLKYKVGEPPALFSSVDAAKTAEKLKYYLENRGIFQTKTEYEIKEKEKKASVKYTAHIHPPYSIANYYLPEDTSALTNKIHQAHENTLINEGESYDLLVMENERERIQNALKDRGYYYFSGGDLIFQADTTIEERKVNLYLKAKPDITSEKFRVYKINRIFLHPKYSLGQDTTNIQTDTTFFEDIHFIGYQGMVKHSTLTNSIFLRPGFIYTRTNHDLTLNRLMGLGLYKFVNITFDDVSDTTGVGVLDASIFLTPLKKRVTRIELQVVSRSNNFAGPGISASFRNRNFLRGAELFLFTFRFSYETQFSGSAKGLNSYNFELSPELNVPKFMIPFFKIKSSSKYVPKTKFKLSYELLSRPDFYKLGSFNFNAGYKWKPLIVTDHDLNLVAITYTKLFNPTEEFTQIIDKNTFLKRSFEEQFIIGSNYTYEYNNQVRADKRNHVYFKGNADFAGNLIHAIQLLIKDTKPVPDTPFTLFDLPYANYSKGEVDGRFYYTVNQSNKLVPRLNIGVGIPYGNSSVLPYVKQFFIGGTNSIRAFRARSLGPGSFAPSDTVIGNFFLEQSGDIKIESNLEHRIDLTKLFKLALFVDAGNIWLIKENPDKPGGLFKWKTFLKEFAIGPGIGLRIDANFFVLRFDLAMPVRKPWLPENERWVLDKIDFSSSEWRRDNLLLNIAIGYPF